MPEKTKEKLSDEINKILGTTIDLTKLAKDDLVELHEALTKLKETIPIPLLDRPLGEIIDNRIGNRPLKELSLADILGLPKERKGIFGFGILPGRILERERTPEEGQGKT